MAFVGGIVLLTVLPFVQKRFLSAPTPLASLNAWSLTDVDSGAQLTQATTQGHVLLVSLAAAPCDAPCLERTAALGRVLEHTDDLGDAVWLLTVAMPDSAASLKGRGHGRWHVVSGDRAQVDQLLQRFRAAWAVFAGTDAGTTAEDLAKLPAFIVVDQDGWVRGFWRDDSAGRGNAINAARLLAKHGPSAKQ